MKPRILSSKFIFIGFIFGFGIVEGAKAEWLQIAPFYGVRFGGSIENDQTGQSLDFEPSASAGAILAVPVSPRGEYIEFLYSRQDSELSSPLLNNSIDVRTEEWQLGLSREFPPNYENLKPFLVGTLGVTNFDFSNNLGSDTLFAMGLGGGVKYFPTKNVALRLDIRGFVSFVEGSGGIACSGGCVASYQGSTFFQGEIAPSLLVQF